MSALAFHPIAAMFPLMEGAEFDALVSDIAEYGQREPITLCDGMILDGRNRYRACLELGLKPETCEYTGDNPEAFVISLNLHRRHLTKEQRDGIIYDLRSEGKTLQEIADTTGLTAEGVRKILNRESSFQQVEITNSRGQLRPSTYAPRQEPDDDEDELDDEEFNRQQIIEANRAGWTIQVPEPKPHVSYNSGNNEWYTPPEYIAATRAVMGGIDLDPASTAIANQVVGAETFYTAEDNGLLHEWYGRVFMNPPYASELIGKFADKLTSSPEVTEAIVLVNNATETRWFQVFVERASAVCFPAGRVRFWNPDKESAPLQGQALIYIGDNPALFRQEFCIFGWTASL